MRPRKLQISRQEAVDANRSIVYNNNTRHPVVKAAMKRNNIEGKVREAVDTGLTVNEADRRFKEAKTPSQKQAATIEVRGGAIRRARNGEPMDLIIGVNPDRNK